MPVEQDLLQYYNQRITPTLLIFCYVFMSLNGYVPLTFVGLNFGDCYYYCLMTLYFDIYVKIASCEHIGVITFD